MVQAFFSNLLATYLLALFATYNNYYTTDSHFIQILWAEKEKNNFNLTLIRLGFLKVVFPGGGGGSI